MRIDIRPAVLSDIEGMSRVVDACWKTNFSEFMPQSVIERLTGEHRRSAFAKQLSCGAVVNVLLVDGVITAVASGNACEERIFADCFEIVQLYVLPEKQHSGLGKKLLMYTLRCARKDGFVCAMLETAAENTKARAFYERFGFEELKSHARNFGGTDYVTYKIDF